MWRVMIADDEPYIREGMEKLIDWKSLGCELVYSAGNGQELMEEIKREKPDIIIADIRMPLMSGLEVAQYICEHQLDIEVIILTAYADFQYAKEAIRCQVSDYIVKTSALEDIPAAIEKLKKKLEERQLSIYRMMLVHGAGSAENHRRFMMLAFEGYEFRMVKAGKDELCIVFTMRVSDSMEDLIHAGEKFSALCRSFLGVTAPVLFSMPYDDARKEYSVYTELVRYWQGHDWEAEEHEVFVIREAGEEDAWIDGGRLEEAGAGAESTAEAEDLVSKIAAYIQDNFAKKITLDEIAEAVHANRSYLSRFYKQRTGRNLFDEINDMRVEKAKEYIKEGRYKIYEIAGKTGFDDNAYFSRVFKKYTGMSPKEYETVCRGKSEEG